MKETIKKLPLLRLIVASICAFLLLAAVYEFVGEGRQHVEPARLFRLAEQDWNTGLRVKALKSYLRASTMAIDAGARWVIARFYINQMAAHQAAGQMDQALASCSRAVAILYNYDDEGSLSYECFAIEGEIREQDKSE